MVTKTEKTVKTQLDSLNVASNDFFRQSMERSMTALTDWTNFGKENMEAATACATAATKGMEAINAAMFGYQKQFFDNAVAAAKQITSSKSIQEAVEAQADYAKGAFESHVAEVNKVSEMMSGLVKETIRPINDRANAFVHMVQVAR